MAGRLNHWVKRLRFKKINIKKNIWRVGKTTENNRNASFKYSGRVKQGVRKLGTNYSILVNALNNYLRCIVYISIYLNSRDSNSLRTILSF